MPSGRFSKCPFSDVQVELSDMELGQQDMEEQLGGEQGGDDDGEEAEQGWSDGGDDALADSEAGCMRARGKTKEDSAAEGGSSGADMNAESVADEPRDGASGARGGSGGHGGARRSRAAYWFECRCGDRFWLPQREVRAVQASIAVPCRWGSGW